MSKAKQRPYRAVSNRGKDPAEIYLCFRIEAERKDLRAIYNESAYPCDVRARDEVLKILAANGYEILATGEGRYADAWIKKRTLADAAGL